MTLAKYEFTVGKSHYTAEQLEDGGSLVCSTNNRFKTKSYLWDDVLENIRQGWWKLVKVLVEPATTNNLIDTPEKVEVGDTIVFFWGRGDVERRSKGVVSVISTATELGHGKFFTADRKVIDSSSSGVRGLYIVKKAEKPKFSAKDAAIGTIMSNFSGNYLNIKTGHNKWQEIVDNALNDEYDTMSDAFIQESFNTPEQHHPAIVFQP